jgi:hypothetical protein
MPQLVTCSKFNASQAAQDLAIQEAGSQALSLAGNVLSLTNGGSITLPAAPALDCADVIDCVTAQPVGPAAVPGTTQVLGSDGLFHLLPVGVTDNDNQTLSISGNIITIAGGNSITLPAAVAPTPQTLSVSGQTLTLSGGGGSVTLPDLDTQDLSLVGNVLSLTNGGSVTLPAGATQDPYATPAQTVAGTATNLIVNPADLVARENIPAQTGVSNDVTAIPAPTASQSPWAVNLLGETLHYAPGIGWRVVANHYSTSATTPNQTPIPTPGTYFGTAVTCPRAGRVLVTGYVYVETYNTAGGVFCSLSAGLAKNGTMSTAENSTNIGPQGATTNNGTAQTHAESSSNTSPSAVYNVLAGDIIQPAAIVSNGAGIFQGFIDVTYLD